MIKKSEIVNILGYKRYKFGLTEKQIREKLKTNKSLHKTLMIMHRQEYPIARYKKNGKGSWIYWDPEHMHHMNKRERDLMESQKVQLTIWK